MSKKYIIYGVFSALALLMIGIILCNTHAIKSDVYDLLNLQVNPQEKKALEAIEQNIAHQVSFLSKDFSTLEYFENLNKTFDIFEEITIKANQNIDTTQELKALKIATLNKESLYLLQNNPKEFFTNNIRDLFNGFNINPLGSSDLLNLSSHSTLLNATQNLRLDLSSMRLYTTFDDEVYYVGTAILKENYKSDLLLEYIKAAKEYALQNNATLLVNSSTLFSAEAKREGNKEAIFMGGISLVLLISFLLLVFKNIHIFKLIFIVAFSFICGICGVIVLLGQVHLLSIVISTSLIGLILDFAMHFLSSNQSEQIRTDSVKKMKKLFLIALFITSSGYLVFLASPMYFLHQIAIISVCSLCGAFLSTYFLLPYLLEGRIFTSTALFSRALFMLHRCGTFILRFKAVFVVGICVILISSIPLLKPTNFEDNIKQYSSLPKHLIDETTLFSRIVQSQIGTQFILLPSLELNSESSLISSLMQKQLISNAYGLSSMLLSPKQQQEVKDILVTSLQSEEISSLYHQMGFSKNDLAKITSDIQSTPIISPNEALKSPLLRQLNVLITHDNSRQIPIVFLNNPTKDKAFFDVLNSHQATFVDFIATINHSFMEIKQDAIMLKIFAFAFALLILSLFFGFKRGGIMTALVLLSTLLSGALLLLFGAVINIFVIFGLIVASAIGVDYMLFATNHALSLEEKMQSITLASTTSIISFVLLIFSATQAVVSFGAAVSLGMALAAIFAILLALSYHKENV